MKSAENLGTQQQRSGTIFQQYDNDLQTPDKPEGYFLFLMLYCHLIAHAIYFAPFVLPAMRC